MLVVGRLLHDLIDEILALRARAHQRHISLQHIPELRQLVEAPLAHHRPPGRATRVVFLRELRTVIFCVDVHRAKLVDEEGMAVEADPFLPVEDRTGRRQAHPQDHVQQQGRQSHQHQEGNQEVDQALDQALPTRHEVLPDLDQHGAVNRAHLHIAQQDVVHVRNDLDQYLLVEIEQNVEDLAQAVVLRRFNGDDHLLDMLFLDDAGQILDCAQTGQIRFEFLPVLPVGIYETEDLVAEALLAARNIFV